MTLIAGCRAWKGICLATDTRLTHEPPNASPFPTDDCQKCEILKGGLALAVSGDVQTATLFRFALEENYRVKYQQLARRRLNGETLTEEPETVLIEIVTESLREISNKAEVFSRPVSKTNISGLVGMLDTVPLKLKSSECKNIIQAVNQARSVNEVIMEYLPEMIDCAKEKIQFVEISSLRQSVLISFENMIGSVLSVEPVPFGLVTVHGSGASKDHQEDQFQTLAYTLIETPVDNIEDAAFHLTRTHGHSEQTVPINPNYGFKTFGGATLAMMLVPFPSNPQFRVDLQVLTGDAFRQDDKKMISSVYLNDSHQLCGKGEDGKENVLVPFSKYSQKIEYGMKMSARQPLGQRPIITQNCSKC